MNKRIICIYYIYILDMLSASMCINNLKAVWNRLNIIIKTYNQLMTISNFKCAIEILSQIVYEANRIIFSCDFYVFDIMNTTF